MHRRTTAAVITSLILLSNGLSVSKADEVNPVPEGIEYPAFKQRPEFVTRLQKNPAGGYLGVDPELPLKQATSDSELDEQAEKEGQALLRKMVTFLQQQSSIAFELEIHTDEQGTMGFVHGDVAYAVSYAKPNQMRFKYRENPEYDFGSQFWCDGKYLMRYVYDKCLILDAPPTLADITKSEAARTLDRWRPDVPRIMSLLDTDALESLISTCRVEHVGTHQLGAVQTDHLVLDGGGNTETGGFFWDLYITQGKQPVPVLIELGFDGVFQTLLDRERFSDSSVRFVNWKLDAATDPSDFKISIPSDREFIDSLDRWGTGEQKKLNPMVGKPLPNFAMTDEELKTFQVEDFMGDQPLVLYLLDDTGHQLGAWWKQIEPIQKEFEQRGVAFVAVHSGRRKSSDIREELKKWKATPATLMQSDDLDVFAPGAWFYDWYGKPELQDVGASLQVHVIGTDGRIHHVVNRGMKMQQELRRQLNGLLEGKDMARENSESLRSEIAARAARIEFLKKALADE
ncbi:MAG: DUF2092 domain-containing protein [Planctomycetota bacterium]